MIKGQWKQGVCALQTSTDCGKGADRASANATMMVLSLSLEPEGSAILQTLGDEGEKDTQRTISRYLKIEESSHPC